MFSPKLIQIMNLLKKDIPYSEIRKQGIYSDAHGYALLKRGMKAGLITKKKKIFSGKHVYGLTLEGGIFLNAMKRFERA